MKRLLFCVAALAVSTPLLAQTLPSGENLDAPSTLGSEQSCVGECEAVYADCRAQCGETTARAHQEHFDIADVPVGECLQGCQGDLAECKKTCD